MTLVLPMRQWMVTGAAIMWLATQSPAAAELPPQYTVWQAYAAIAALDEIPEKLGVVDRIERLDFGRFIARGGNCALDITVVREPSRGADGRPMPGPSRIVRLDVGPKTCKPDM